MQKKANIKDKQGDDVYFGDTFWAYIMIPSSVPPVKVTVVEDNSPENLECDRNYDVEDEKGNRIWNAYMVIKSCGERADKPHNWDNGTTKLIKHMENDKYEDKKTVSNLVLSEKSEKQFRNIVKFNEYVEHTRGRPEKRREKGFDSYFLSNL